MRDRQLEDHMRQGYILDDEVWATCAYFENYEVSNWGRVRHAAKQTLKKFSYNNYDIPYVSLWDLHLRRRVNKAVATLIAETFIPKERDDFDTVVHLNGDRSDISVRNLKWRTRSFAINYHRQVSSRSAREFVDHTFICMEDNSLHYSTYQVGMKEGVLPSAVWSSVLHNDQWYDPERPWSRYSVFPTGKSYRSIGKYSFADTTGW